MHGAHAFGPLAAGDELIKLWPQTKAHARSHREDVGGWTFSVFFFLALPHSLHNLKEAIFKIRISLFHDNKNIMLLFQDHLMGFEKNLSTAGQVDVRGGIIPSTIIQQLKALHMFPLKKEKNVQT